MPDDRSKTPGKRRAVGDAWPLVSASAPGAVSRDLSSDDVESGTNVPTAKRRAKRAKGPDASATAGKLIAEQRRAARRLEAETRQKESDDRFTPPGLVHAVEVSFGGIDFDPCWHSASAVRPKGVS